MLFHVYAEPKPDGYFDPKTEPFGIYRQILDADWLLWILLPLLLLIVVGLLILAWRIHEIPAHRADHKTMRQAELVSALTLLGLFQHWVWAVALFIAYMDWQATEDWLVGILRRAKIDDRADAVPPAPTSAPAAAAPIAPPLAVPVAAPAAASAASAPPRQEPKA